jgi:choline-sulfatase
MSKQYDKIVFVSLDTLRSDALLSNPNPLWPEKYRSSRKLRESALDLDLREAAYFHNCISAAPYTSASHAAFFTGVWPRNNGVYEFFNRPLVTETIFTAGKKMGYRTAWKVDFPLILGPHLGLNRDVDHYLVEDDDVLIDCVQASDRVMAFAHFGSPHIPYGFHNLRFGGRRYSDRVKALEEEAGIEKQTPGDQLVETYRDPADLELLFRYKNVVQHHYERAQYDRLFDLYLEGVDYFLHDRFERFWNRLKSALHGSSWLIVVFADHGEEYDADSYGHHNSLNDGVLRVPLAFMGHDICAATHSKRIRSIDMVPSILDRLGANNLLGELDGSSLASSIWDTAEFPVRPCIAQAYTSDTSEFVAHQQQMLRTGRHAPTLKHVLYKEAVYRGNHKLTRQAFRYAGGGGIFGLEACSSPDRLFEQSGSAGAWVHREELEDEEELRAILAAYNRGSRDLPPIDVSPGVRESLRDMGYRI